RSSRLDADPAAIGVEGVALLVDQPAHSAEAAAARAQSILDARAAGAVTLRGVAAGEAGLWAGGLVEVSGLDPVVDGRYVVTGAAHTVDAAGYQCAFTTEPPD